jgi:hypothetical protein
MKSLEAIRAPPRHRFWADKISLTDAELFDGTRLNSRAAPGYQPSLPGAPLNGPANSGVIQPP